jgi:23S rRNA (uracil1939-C5)-methyltransferase
MGLPYADQLTRKGARLQEAIGLYPHLRLPAPTPVRPALFEEAYRHRFKLPLWPGPEQVQIGLTDPRSGRVVHTPDCPVLSEGLRAALPVMLDWMRGRKGLHSLDLRQSAATGQLQAVLACQGGDLHGGPHAARKLMERVPGLSSVAVSTADPEGRRVKGDQPRVIAGARSVEEAIGETRYRLHPGAFFQVDPRNAAQVHQLLAEMAGPARRVLDLYSGVGAYARMLAARGCEVVAVEEDPEAAAAARVGAPAGLTVVQGKVEEADLRGRFDLVILNPARRGSDPETLARLPRLASRAVYISCGPETLARDLDCLAAHGMRATEIAPIDLFPQTPEVETLVKLEIGPPLRDWAVPGGRAGGPWAEGWSGVRGRPEMVLALLIGDTGASGQLQAGRFRRIGEVATHSLVRIELQGPMIPALAELSRRGHPVAGRDPRTARFFREKVGLVRPFLHIERSTQARAPLHGDLVVALRRLGASPALVERAGG